MHSEHANGEAEFVVSGIARVRGGTAVASHEAPPPESVRQVLYHVSLGLPLAPGAARRAMLDLATVPGSEARDNLLAALLTGLMARGPAERDVVEVLSAALSFDDLETTELQSPPGSRLVLLAGSGKKGIKSFNISTASAIVAASEGAAVVKMGSRATSSVMGSRDLAESLGLTHSLTEAEITAALARTQLAFVPIEEMIPVLDGLYGGRFHVLNPLSFGLAALAARLRGGVMVFGLAHPKVDLAARVLSRFGVSDAVVVASGNSDGYYADEFGLGEQSLLCHVEASEVKEIRTYRSHEVGSLGPVAPGWAPPPATPAEAQEWVLRVLAGRGHPVHTHLVAVNAAVILTAAGLARDIHDGYERAQNALHTGRAWAKTEEIREEALCTQTV